MCHAAAKNFGGLMATRFFLGVGEAAIAPGFALVTGMFYKREEQPSRYVDSRISGTQYTDTVKTSRVVSRKLCG